MVTCDDDLGANVSYDTGGKLDLFLLLVDDDNCWLAEAVVVVDVVPVIEAIIKLIFSSIRSGEKPLWKLIYIYETTVTIRYL